MIYIKFQMMFYVNAFSAFLCLVSLLQQLTFFSSFSFILTHYDMLRDCCLLSLGSACGQVEEFHTNFNQIFWKTFFTKICPICLDIHLSDHRGVWAGGAISDDDATTDLLDHSLCHLFFTSDFCARCLRADTGFRCHFR